MQTLAIFVALLSLSAVGATNSTHKVSPGECHCGCCAPVESGEKACTAPVGALHSTTKTDMCRTVYCTNPSDTQGAQDQGGPAGDDDEFPGVDLVQFFGPGRVRLGVVGVPRGQSPGP